MNTPTQPSLLRNRGFAIVWWGGLLTLTGHGTLGVALSAYVYIATGSALATSLMFAANALPRLLLSPLAGVFVDRWPRARVLVVSNLLLAGGTLPLLLVGDGSNWLVYLVFALQSAIFRFFEPAETALLPTLVQRAQLPAANALNALNNNLGRLAGPSLGGLLVAVAGLPGVVIANAVLYLGAAALIATLRIEETRACARVDGVGDVGSAASAFGSAGDADITNAMRELREGLRITFASPIPRLLATLLSLTAIGEGVFSVLITPFTLDVLGVGAVELGWLRSIQGAGGIVGGLLVAGLANRLSPAVMLGVGGMVFGLVDLAIFNYPSLIEGFAPALVLMALVGVPAAAYGAGVTTLLQSTVDDRSLGKVLGVLATLGGLFGLLGIAVAGKFADVVGIVPILNIQGYGYVLAGAVFWLLLRGHTWANLGPERSQARRDQQN